MRDEPRGARRVSPSRIGFAAVGLGLVVGCGPPRVPSEWIAERTASARCTTVGPQRMPPVLLDLHSPPLPTGFYARSADPMALDELGFERDTVACAMLLAPDGDAITTATADVLNLAVVHARVGAQSVAAVGRCACEVAQAQGLRDLIAPCRRRPVERNCDASAGARALRAEVQPLLDVIATTVPPVVHWRMVGRTDRKGWFGEHFGDLVARHRGGSTIYASAEAVPARHNHVLLRGLLELDDVVAVVRQDGGRGLLVVREIGRRLVLDHFSYPVVDARHSPLLDALDNAHIAAYRIALEKPTELGKLVFDPAEGNTVEVDRAHLSAVDRFIAAGAPLGSIERRQADLEPDTEWVDHVAFTAPFGHDGGVLRGRFELGQLGRLWAQGLAAGKLSPTLVELGLGDPPAGQPDALPFVYRGTLTQSVLFEAPRAVPPVAAAIERAHPSTIQGDTTHWRFELPASDLREVFADSPVLRQLREHLKSRPHRVEVELDPKRSRLDLELAPG